MSAQFNYKVDCGKNYSTLSVKTYHIIDMITEKAPKHTGAVMYYILSFTQYLNRDNDDRECRPFMASIRDIAEALEPLRPTAVQRCVKWMKDNQWLEVVKEGSNKSQFYLDVDKLNQILKKGLCAFDEEELYKLQADELVQMRAKLVGKSA